MTTRTCGTCASYTLVLGICAKTKRTVNAKLKPFTPCWRARRRIKGELFVAEKGYLKKWWMISFFLGGRRFKIMHDKTYTRSTTARRQARRIAKRLGIEVEG